MIWDRVQDALTSLAIPMGASTYVATSGSNLPDEFLVYTLISAPPTQHADDAEKLRAYRVQVSYYNRTGLEGHPDIDAVMVAAGFRRGPQRDLPYNQLTRHHGLALEYIYLNEE